MAVAGHPAGQVREELAGAGGFHERPENDEQRHKGGGHPGDGTEDTGIRDQKLHFNDFRQRDGLGIKHARQVWGRIQVDKKPGDQECHGRHHGPSDRFQQQQDHGPAQDHFNGQDLIHKFQTFGQPLMKIHDIQRRQNRHRRQYPVDDAHAFVRVFFQGWKQDKGGRQQKQQVNAPLDAGLVNADRGGIQLENGNDHQPGSNGFILP